MTIGDALAIGLGIWAVASIPLTILILNHRISMATIEFVKKHPEYELTVGE